MSDIGPVEQRDLETLPHGLPVPVDDGRAAHLMGAPLPDLSLATTAGPLRLGDLEEPLVLYVYPRTGRPNTPLPEGWDDMPGARGCTPQACGFRDLRPRFTEIDATILGVSSQTLSEQREAASRLALKHPLAADPEFTLAAALDLPTFSLRGKRYFTRLTLIIRDGRIGAVFYPIFPPSRSAADALAWLNAHRDQ